MPRELVYLKGYQYNLSQDELLFSQCSSTIQMWSDEAYTPIMFYNVDRENFIIIVMSDNFQEHGSDLEQCDQLQKARTLPKPVTFHLVTDSNRVVPHSMTVQAFVF